MNKHGLEQAKIEFDRAKEKYSQMRSSADLKELTALWSEFLTQTQKVFNKLNYASDSNQSMPWFGKVKHTRKTDDLLIYIHQARHADEHGIAPIVRQEFGGIGIGVRGENVHIKSMTISGGQINAQFYGAPPTIKFYPAHVALIPVTNKGQVYSPPKIHLGQPLDEVTALNVANLAVQYLTQILFEAEGLA